MSSPTTQNAPPMPPLALRMTVGHTGTEEFENPDGRPVFGPEVPPEAYEAVLDFGCGCGRLARQLMLQAEGPRRFLGLDLYEPSIRWCRRNLTPHDRRYQFRRLNAFNPELNRRGRVQRPFPTRDDFTLVNAHSVFTHIVERDAAFYFEECRRRLRTGGVFRATWFLFDKTAFPMMQTFQNALYINLRDPTNAVIYDRAFVQDLYHDAGLRIYAVRPPAMRGFQWEIYARLEEGEPIAFPADDAPAGIMRPPSHR